jgi:hypothetical protein
MKWYWWVLIALSAGTLIYIIYDYVNAPAVLPPAALPPAPTGIPGAPTTLTDPVKNIVVSTQKAGSTGTNNDETTGLTPPTGNDPSSNPYNVMGYGLRNATTGLWNGIDGQVSSDLNWYLSSKTVAAFNIVIADASNNGFVWSPPLPILFPTGSSNPNPAQVLKSIF